MFMFWNRLLKDVLFCANVFQRRLYKCISLHSGRLNVIRSFPHLQQEYQEGLQGYLHDKIFELQGCISGWHYQVFMLTWATALCAGLPSCYNVLISLVVVSVFWTLRSVPVRSTAYTELLARHPTPLRGTAILTCICFHRMRTWDCGIWNRPVKTGTTVNVTVASPVCLWPNSYESVHLFSYLLGCVWSK